MEDNLNMFENVNRPQYFFLMEVDLNFFENGIPPQYFSNARWPYFFSNEKQPRICFN
jgi:hypothetical protein